MTRLESRYRAPKQTRFSRSSVVWDAPGVEAVSAPSSLAWVAEATGHVEAASVVENAVGAITANSRISAPAAADSSSGQPHLEYLLETDPVLRTRLVSLRRPVTGESLTLTSNGRGDWRVGDHAAPELSGALDVDIRATPLTNTLPMRRLGLEVGEDREISVAYIDTDTFAVFLDRQRYRRLGRTRYLFQAVDGSFEREITTDEQSFVTSYPGLFTRL
ncbi:putative glycolipid-binding domain-containing protein [Pseudoclavibacter sp. AY1F1]|uniref:putative glycolipid-binding domain-containing protein n=1 Tax=Pseudoclavibacter sp. AY1F1 TaxID=2080583 RepID=UPI0015E3A708|nr:putative glycolipid-binding domain-containing protein [Pseudoclavibacter sp. AY1F1]